MHHSDMRGHNAAGATITIEARFFNSLAIGGSATLLDIMAAACALYGLTRCPASLRWPSLGAIFTAAVILSLTAIVEHWDGRMELIEFTQFLREHPMEEEDGAEAEAVVELAEA